MYLSAERLALANQAVRETFAQTSIVWQAIPHWETGDPGQIRVADGIYVNPPGPGSTELLPQEKRFQVTLAQANAPAPNLLLTEVMAMAKELARLVDVDVLPKLYTKALTSAVLNLTPQPLLNSVIDARAAVEDAGYRAPSCVITNTEGLKKLSLVQSGVSMLPQLQTAANINALHRTKTLDPPDTDARIVFIGRRRRIPQGAAPEASPGEEPVDIAVSLMPSLEVVGETATGEIELSVRIRYATRITDATGLVALHNP